MHQPFADVDCHGCLNPIRSCFPYKNPQRHLGSLQPIISRLRTRFPLAHIFLLGQTNRNGKPYAALALQVCPAVPSRESPLERLRSASSSSGPRQHLLAYVKVFQSPIYIQTRDKGVQIQSAILYPISRRPSLSLCEMVGLKFVGGGRPRGSGVGTPAT